MSAGLKSHQPAPSIGLVEMIEKGVIAAPVVVFGYYEETRFEATLNQDGTFLCGGELYNSPSVAAGRAITKMSGRRSPGRGYWSINGWNFWQVPCDHGAPKTLAAIRQEMVEDAKRS